MQHSNPRKLKKEVGDTFVKFVGWLGLFIIGFVIFGAVMDDTKPAKETPEIVVETPAKETPKVVVETPVIEAPKVVVTTPVVKAPVVKPPVTLEEIAARKAAKAKADKEKKEAEAKELKAKIAAAKALPYSDKRGNWIAYHELCKLTKNKSFCDKSDRYRDEYYKQQQQQKQHTKTYAMTEQQALMACRDEFRRQGIFGSFTWSFNYTKISSTKVIIVRQVIKTNFGKQTHQCAVKPNGQVNYQGRVS